jgi:hypothetical protein
VSVLQAVLTGLCVLIAVILVVHLVRDQTPGNLVDGMLVVLELGLVVELVLGLVRVFGDHAGVSVPTYVGYLIGTLVIPPVAWVWSASERSRGGTTVLLVGVLLVPFMFLRLAEVWSTHG